MMQTERLLLRRFQEGDAPALHAYLSDPAVVRYEPYPPQTPAQCEETLAGMIASPAFWAVCLREGGRLIGQVYLGAGEQQSWELGYVFDQWFQGRGFAFEATQALLSSLFAGPQAHRVFAQCNPENSRSWRLLERLGFRREGRLVQNVFFETDPQGRPLWQDTYLYGLLACEWGGETRDPIK